MFERKAVSREETVLLVEGMLTGDATAEFQRQMEEIVASGVPTVTLDLSRTVSINSATLGKILLFRKKLAEQKRALQIRGCSDGLYKTFQMIRFDTLISIRP